MYGVIIGSIAGSRFELNEYRTKDFNLFEGYFPEDAMMAIAIAQAIMNCEGDYDNSLRYFALSSMRRMRYEYSRNCYKHFHLKWLRFMMDEEGRNDIDAAMRVSAAGWAGKDLDEVEKIATEVTKATHIHPDAILAAKAVASAIYLARNGKTIDEIKEYITKHFYVPTKTLDELRPIYEFETSCPLSVPEAFEAFYESTSFEDAIRNAVSLGGYSLPIAAITGSIAEAYYGIPEEMIEKAKKYMNDYFIRTINDFENIYGNKVIPVHNNIFNQQDESQIDIVSVISEHVELTKKGNRYSGCCPFHSEKTPSFYVDPDKKLYHCFGCGKGGNVVGFVMEMENVDFLRALEILADKAHIALPKQEMSKAEEERFKRRQKYLHINLDAARYYYSALRGKYGSVGMNYFAEKRKFSKEIMEKFRLGYSPLEGNFLIKNLKDKGYSETDLEKAGLIVKDLNDNYYDKFFGRVIFPIFDACENIVGFGSRAIEGNESNSIISPESEIFHKGDVLYGFNKAKRSEALRNYGYLILCKNYMDVITLHEAGIDNSAALLDNTLSEKLIKLLKRYTDNVVLVYNSNTIDYSYNYKLIDTLVEYEINVKILSIPNGMNPDEFIRTYGKKEFNKLLHSAIGHIEFELNEYKNGLDLYDPTCKKEYIDRVFDRIRKVNDSDERHLYFKLLSEIVNVNINTLIKYYKTEDDALINYALIVKPEKTKRKRKRKPRVVNNKKQERKKLIKQEEYRREVLAGKKFYY